MQNQLDRILRDGADAVFKYQAMPTLEYNDTVANPYSRYAMYISDDSYPKDQIFNHDHAKMVEGWEWLRQDYDVQYVNKKYPIEVSYRFIPHIRNMQSSDQIMGSHIFYTMSQETSNMSTHQMK